jgi:hypothetical protein
LEQKDVQGSGSGVKQQNSGTKRSATVIVLILGSYRSNHMAIERDSVVVVIDQGRGFYSLR